eukprot:5665187-Prymnesium_polylepis.1
MPSRAPSLWLAGWLGSHARPRSARSCGARDLSTWFRSFTLRQRGRPTARAPDSEGGNDGGNTAAGP